MARRKKPAKVTAVSMAEVIALARVTRFVRDAQGAIVGVERIDGKPVGSPVDIDVAGVLAADKFLSVYQGRPMA